MNRQSFKENVIIITGAASGIGRHLAIQFAELGAWLALADCNVEQLEAVTNYCNQQMGKAIGIPTDVSIQSQCQNLIDKTVAQYGRIDTLVNNAGIVMVSRFESLKDLTLFEKIIQVNFFGSVYCTHYALPYLKLTSGRLVGIASLRGLFPSATADGYGASKFALTEFLSSLRIELSGSGISVTIIYPNYVRTGMSSRAIKADGSAAGKNSKHELGAMSVDQCSRQIIKAIEMRRRDVVMTIVGKLKLWIKLLAPKVNDHLAKRADTSLQANSVL